MLNVTLIACLCALAPQEGARAELERAVLDYAESYYEVRPEYVERSIHPELDKLGHRLQENGEYEARAMSYADFHGMITSIQAGGSRPEPGPKEVEVLDQLDQTALVKLRGSWGVDYMQLARFDGRWQTRHVLWQTEPRPFADAAAREAEVQGVEAAVRDYLEALYEVDSRRIERSVDRALGKFGFFRHEVTEPYFGIGMTFTELHDLADLWNSSGELPADAPREIEVLDVMDKIACARLTAEWGIDTLLLHKLEGRWLIRHVMWQSHPLEEQEAAR